jgi:hypothetical protein
MKDAPHRATCLRTKSLYWQRDGTTGLAVPSMENNMYYEDKNGNFHPVRTMRQLELATRQCAEALANGTAVVARHGESEYAYAQQAAPIQ